MNSVLKHLPLSPGIYAVVNTLNERRYVGSSNNILRRCAEHRKLLKAGRHDCPALQNAWNKYGEANFQFITVEVLPEADELSLLEREQFYLDTLPNLYNACLTAGKPPSTKGRKLRPRSAEHSRKIAESKAHLTDESRNNLRKAQLGKKASEGTRLRMSLRKRGQPSTFKGKTHRPESKAKTAETLRNKPLTAFNLSGLRAHNESQRGVPRTEEVKSKIRQSVLAANARKKEATV